MEENFMKTVDYIHSALQLAYIPLLPIPESKILSFIGHYAQLDNDQREIERNKILELNFINSAQLDALLCYYNAD